VWRAVRRARREIIGFALVYAISVAVGVRTMIGLTIVSPYGFAGYSGWVGGIVLVDRQHHSRLAEWRQATHYLVTLVLQLTPYAIAGGVGVRLGLSYFRGYAEYRGERKWLGYPTGALGEILRVYALITPLFLIASRWEFLSPWNLTHGPAGAQVRQSRTGIQ
jgi:uncharacterized membrane protein (Fun14 family)